MRYSWRGRAVAAVAFLAIAALVTGGLGWVTAAALRLEQERLQSRIETDHGTRLRLALWRLDSRLVTDLAREANRPFHHYSAVTPAAPRQVAQTEGQGPAPAPGPAQTPLPQVVVLELALLPDVEPAPWMAQNLMICSVADWRTPHALRETLIRRLNVSQQAVARGPQPPAANDEVLLRALEEVRRNETLPGPQGNYFNDGPSSQQQVHNTGNASKKAVDRDTELRFGRSIAEKGMPQINPDQQEANRRSREDLLPAVVGPLVPLWLKDGGDDRLVVARLLRIGPKLACQVTVLDWPQLRAVLAEEVREFFPEPRFLPIHEGESPNPERALTALPLELDPGPMAEAAPQGWTPLRIGLALAGTAALVALSAVGLGGWLLLDLSERRIRFVSAVTHELRTPLTTLRLYLDMLTGGVIKEEPQKEEYLRTLHGEAERLHRLIGNVLDFSRLENGRPRLEKRTVTVAELLQGVRSAWASTCERADKELVFDNDQPEGTQIYTDPELATQILGNLIDNACKYSRGAADRRVWVRARADGARLLLEVEDRGPGVAPGDGRSIFRPFRRGHGADVTAGGVGLGLALAQRWARLLGGRLELCDGSGQGACFRLALPG